MTDAQLLGEIEDLLRTMPPRATIHHPEPDNEAWFGRALAIVGQWDSVKAVFFRGYVNGFTSYDARVAEREFPKIMSMINEARFDLRMKSVGPLSTAFEQGKPFDYFDEVRKIIERASTDVFFIDPYMETNFVSRYLPHVPAGVPIRLLTSPKPKLLPMLLPAVELYAKQASASIGVRSEPSLHDRFVFIDRSECYLSGASFKDGARLSPATLTQITDAFSESLQVYEGLWSKAKIERP